MFKAKEGMKVLPQFDPLHVFDVNEIVRIVVHAHAERWKTAGIAFKIDLAENLPHISIDPHQLEQVLVVLVANAEDAISANVGRPGQIQLRTSLHGQRLQVTITDNGRGIHSREMAHLFDGQSRDTELTSCAGIIRDFGGELYAWSNYGNGSAFTIEMPVTPMTTPLKGFEESGLHHGLHGKHILVIDDEVQIAALMFDVLAQQGAKIDLANSGTQAVERIRAKQYDLFICDQWMPDLTGERLYRSIELTNPELRHRFLFVTGDVSSEGIDQFLTQSGVKYIRKPFRMVELVAAAEEVVNRNLRRGF